MGATVAIIWLYWPKNDAECEVAEFLLAESSAWIAEHASSGDCTLIIAGDRIGLAGSSTFAAIKSQVKNEIFLGSAAPSHSLVEVMALLSAFSNEHARYEYLDVASGSAKTVICSAPRGNAASTVAGLLIQADSASRTGSANSLAGVLGSFPQALASFDGIWFASAMERAAAQMRWIASLDHRLLLGEDASTSGGVRARTTLSGMQRSDIYSLGREFSRPLAPGAVELQGLATARAEYIALGAEAARRASSGQFDIHLATLFAWWASYFRARALLFAAQGDLASAVGAVIREMELVLQGRLLERGDGELSTKGEFLLHGRSVLGVRELLRSMEQELAANAGEEVVRGLGETVGCRNNSRVGHGVSALNTEIFDSGLSSVTKAWQGLERSGAECPRILRQILVRFRARLIPKPSSILARQTLAFVQSDSAAESNAAGAV